MSSDLELPAGNKHITISRERKSIKFVRYQVDPRHPGQTRPAPNGLTLMKGDFSWHPESLRAVIAELQLWQEELSGKRRSTVL